MSKIKWSEPSTMAAPPIPKRRKLGNRERSHSKEEWEERRLRIEELYRSHELHEVRNLMEAEGFRVTERQIRAHLDQWGTSKYLTFSKDQWRYMEHKTVCRTLENKNTAFRDKVTKNRIPSEKVHRGLNRRISKYGLRGLSVCGTVSSHGLSAYTSGTHGFQLSSVQARGSFKRFEDDVKNTLDDCLERLRNVYPGDKVKCEAKLTDRTTKFECTIDISINCGDCLHYRDKMFYITLNRQMDSFISGPGFWSNQSLASRGDQSLASRGAVFYYPPGDSGLPLPGVRAPGGSGLPPPEVRALTRIREQFAEFAEDHILSKRHRGRVLSRLLNYPKRHMERVGRSKLAAHACGHGIFPPLDPYWDWRSIIEKEQCWGPGGCGWLQLKAALNQNPKIRESFLNQEGVKILQLESPVDRFYLQSIKFTEDYRTSKLSTFEEISSLPDSSEEELQRWIIQALDETNHSSGRSETIYDADELRFIDYPVANLPLFEEISSLPDSSEEELERWFAEVLDETNHSSGPSETNL